MVQKINDTINFAIDLGTSDSLIACEKNNERIIINNHESNENYTPSVVAIEDDKIIVGQKAKNILLENPENAASEFKVNMGYNIPFEFKDSHRVMLPEQLSARVIKDLMLSTYQQLNEKVEYAVITVPANSNPLKTKATLKAAQMAGLKKSYLILEPVAAAIAYGIKSNDKNKTWLIYDLGGGTFDTSIVKPNGEEIEVLATKGVDNLGGKIFDWQIVDLFVKKIIDQLGIIDLERNNPKYVKVFSKLKNEAEKAKKQLTYEDEVNVYIDNLFDGYTFKYTLTINTLRELMNPFIKNTINICNDLLDEAQIPKCQLDKIILIGGSTLSRVVQEELADEFQIKLEKSINPLTAVVEGAVIYANSIFKPIPPPKENTYSLLLDYERFSATDSFNLKGRIISLDVKSYLSFTIKIFNDKFEKSIPVDIDGVFETTIPSHRKINEYHIKVYDDDKEVKLNENSVNTIKNIKSIKPSTNILPQSIRLGLDNNNTILIASKGVKITYFNQINLFTKKELNEDNLIRIPVCCGENNKIENNILLGMIYITWDDLKKELKSNSLITVQLKIENLDDIEIKIIIPDVGIELTNKFEFNSNPISYEQLTDKYENLMNKISNLNNLKNHYGLDYIRYNVLNTESLDYLNVLFSLSSVDDSIIVTTNDYINKVNSTIEEIDELINVIDLKDNIEHKLRIYDNIIHTLDNQREIERFKVICNEYEKCDKDNFYELQKVYEQLITSYVLLYSNDVIKTVFYNLRYDGVYNHNNDKALELIDNGLNYLNINDYHNLYGVISELYKIDERFMVNCISDVCIN